MPVYEYECRKCGTRFEEIQKFSDPPVKKHNGCGGRVKRLPSAPAFHFKGTGWYVTDYAAKGGKDGGGKSQEKDSEKKTEAKADSGAKSEKAEAQPESKHSESKPKAAKS